LIPEDFPISSRAHDLQPETIRAIRVHAFGEAPRIDELPAPPDPEPGELVVDVAAVGVGAWDLGVAAGRLAKLLPSDDLPFTMGAELCGRVRALGVGVEGFAIGDRVMANPGVVGAWADRVRLRASDCGRAPRRASDAEAATVPVRGLAAWQGLALLDLPSDASLLVVGGGGAVGRAAVEIAHARGLRVFAIAGPDELDMLRQLGAETAIDYHEDWPPEIRSAASGDVDAALDLVGGDSLRQAFGLVRDGGHVVSTVASESAFDPPPGVAFELLRMKSSRAALDALADLVDAGGLSTRIVGSYAFDEAPAALQAVGASDRDPGEIVLHR
jgi:NADPH:quinone reductase-like Zn-dependent oxidoreductase